MSFKLNGEQEEAVFAAMNWYYLESYRKQLFVIGGLAGSGQSTCLRSIIQALGLNNNSVMYCALSGKAVSVLRMKGHSANTIHKSFYSARIFKNNVYFSKKKTVTLNIKLIVIDEFGMVPNSMIKDILSFGIPVIGLGDPGQLPPLFEPNSYIEEKNLDVFLTKVMRTNDTTGILTLAMQARLGNELVPGKYGNSRVLDHKNDIKSFLDYDVVLCWSNKTRRALNQHIREELGITSKYPVAGEKISILGNRYDISLNYMGIELFLVNGLGCFLNEDCHQINDHQLSMVARPYFIDEQEAYFNISVNKYVYDSYHEHVHDTKTLMQIDREHDRGSVFSDFAYALSIHSSQGSEFGNILIIDEMPKYRPEYSKWLYTGITRGVRSVDVLLQ